VQRRSAANETSRGFLAVAKEALVLEPGDVVHLDFGLNYMGLASDWQKMASSSPGETDVPVGLKRAWSTQYAAGRARPDLEPGSPPATYSETI
jgi:methionine aminopeptidase